jgi:hypothetical protein
MGVLIVELLVCWIFRHMKTTEGVYRQGPIVSLGDRKPRQISHMRSEHPFELDATRPRGR